MVKSKFKVILDTNWYISATINKKSRRVLYDILTGGKFVILFNHKIQDEYNLVMTRDKFRKVIAPSQTLRFINLIIPRLKNVEISSMVTGSRDQKDNFLLSLAKDGDADFLVTGDADLLVLEKTGRTRIVTLADFLQITSHKTQ